MAIKNLFSQFMDKLLSFPLWIKQVIYLNLYKDLKKYLSDDFVLIKENELFHIFQPTLSKIGTWDLTKIFIVF